MYYGLFIRVDHKLVRVDTTTGFTLETAKVRFAPLILALDGRGLLRQLPPVKQIDAFSADKKYARTPW